MSPVEALSVSIPGFYDVWPVEVIARTRKPVVRSLTDDLGGMRGVPHHFFGHTADIDASTPETVSFDQCCPRAMVGSSAGGSNTPAAAADD